MKSNRYITVLALATTLSLGSCSDFLSQLPDDRKEVNSTQAVQQLLVTAYPQGGFYSVLAEMSSDNVQEAYDYRDRTSRFYDQVFAWQDPEDRDSDAPITIWSYNYKAINTANVALEQLATMEDNAQNKALKGEALLCRAFGHFVLTNVFSVGYDPTTATTKLGVPYVMVPEKSIDATYTRETIQANFEHIAADLEAGLLLLDDSAYPTGKKFHFTRQAAYAFAARFYLYYQKWDKAISYATLALGSNASAVLRNYDPILALPSTSYQNRALAFTEYNERNNIFFLAGTTQAGYVFGPYERRGARYNHRGALATAETTGPRAAWWADSQTDGNLKLEPAAMVSDKSVITRYPALMIPVSPGSATGYNTSLIPEFTTDETLLVRAEAYIHQADYTNALSDMNAWVANATTGYEPLTAARITKWNNETLYATAKTPTPRKQMQPTFTLRDDQHEHFLQVLLHMRRIETLHTGLRWFDIKRYGIALNRYTVRSGSTISELPYTLSARDNHHAIQLPAEVIASGLEANPR